MRDLDSPHFMDRLQQAIVRAVDSLRSTRTNRTALLKDFVGNNYTDHGKERPMPVNELALMVDTYLMNLAGGVPQVLIHSDDESLLPQAKTLEAVVNQELKDMDSEEKIRQWVLEAIFSIGIMKVGIADKEYSDLIPGEPLPSQEFFWDVVDLDDWVHDVDAKSWDKITFCGDRYRILVDELVENDRYDASARAYVDRVHSGFMQGESRASEIGGADSSGRADERSIHDYVHVWDIWLPEYQSVVTILDDPHFSRPMKVIDWDGPSTGPYHILRFGNVPGNLMPLAPALLMQHLNQVINAVNRKLARQIQKQKTIALVRSGHGDDAKKITNAIEGTAVSVTSDQPIQEVTFQAPSSALLAMAMNYSSMFSRLAGNLDAMAGLGPQAQTATQEQMIVGTVSRKMGRMHRGVLVGVEKLVRHLAWYIWNDDSQSYSASRHSWAIDGPMRHELAPGERQGQFEDFRIDVQPYSLSYMDPRERAGMITNFVTNLAFPALPLLQQQGVSLNLVKLFEMLAKYNNLPELLQVIETAVATPQAPLSSIMPGRGSAGQSRSSGRTGTTTQRDLMQMAMSGGGNNGQSNK